MKRDQRVRKITYKFVPRILRAEQDGRSNEKMFKEKRGERNNYFNSKLKLMEVRVRDGIGPFLNVCSLKLMS